jgi:PAS domain-containing protein
MVAVANTVGMHDSASTAAAEQRFYRTIFEGTSEAIVVLDEHGRVLQMNRAARDLRGVDAARVFGSEAGEASRAAEVDVVRAEAQASGHASLEMRLPGPTAQPGRGRVLRLDASA